MKKVTIKFAIRNAEGRKVWRAVTVRDCGSATENAWDAFVVLRRRYPEIRAEEIR